MADSVTNWLEQLGLGEYAEAFASNHIDRDLLPELDQETLKDLGVVSAGHRLRILKAVRSLETEPEAAVRETVGAPAAATPGSAQPQAERRQLTVMFCDMVGSSELAERLDAEDLRDIIRSYQDACAGAVSRYEGYVARYVGDALLVYFGFPLAHEDDAERAVRAALGILTAVNSLSTRLRHTLQVRIGIATGLVVVGDIVGHGAAQEQAVIGETPNLAARLQAVAVPNSVVVASNTLELAGDQFSVEDLGDIELKGVSEAVRAWRVVSERAVESRFGAAHAGGLTRFVGREQEVDLLLERWRQARAGEGQVVLLAGEAGIGKSRIAHALRLRLRDEPHICIQYQCSSHHTNSPFYPAIQQMAFAAEIASSDTADTKLDKLEALLRRSSAPTATLALMADMLEIPSGERYPALELTPQEQKQRTLEALTGLLEGLALKQPVLFIIEDVHWIDPTTSEQIGQAVDRVRTLPALILITHRPEFETPWRGYPHCTVLMLNRLGQDACEALIADLTRNRELPIAVLKEIIDRTDGVPLFVEELTKTVLESGLLVPHGGRYVLEKPLHALAIPSTLQDSLTARLDRLEEVKEIGQIGAAIGREFSHALLDAVSPLHGTELEAALARLVESNIVFRQGSKSNVTYRFKHALIQDAAYQALLRSRRRQIHARIAEALRSTFSKDFEHAPELLAHHYTQAGLLERAAPLWLEAGQRAVARSANHEARAHLEQGLEVVGGLPRKKDVISLELDMQISRGAASIAISGYSAQETEAAYVRGRELLADIGDDPRQFAILHGLSMCYINQARLSRSLDVAEEMLRQARPRSDVMLRLVAHRVTSVTHNVMARFGSARKHAERAAALYDPNRHGDSAHRYAHDQGVAAEWHLSIALLFLGFVDASARASDRATQRAIALQHANTTLYGLLYSAFTSLVKREWQTASTVAEAMIEDAASRSMALWEVFGRYHLGSALAAQGKSEAGLEQIRRGREEAGRLNHSWLRPMTLRFEAQALADLGRAGEALPCLDAALALVGKTEERWWEAEIHRYRGVLSERCSGVPESGEACFENAMRIARRQQSKLLELRSATSLAQLLRARGRPEEARAVLAPVYQWFTEGSESADLKDARELYIALS